MCLFQICFNRIYEILIWKIFSPDVLLTDNISYEMTNYKHSFILIFILELIFFYLNIWYV